jgi:hypothetical protein
MLKKSVGKALLIVPKGKLKKSEAKGPATNLTDKKPPAALKPGDSKKLKGMS